MNFAPQDRQPGRLRELDGWRAISVLLVAVHHILAFQHVRPLMHFPRLAAVALFCGPLGVKVFFVISGFVICRLLILEQRRYGTVSLKGFYLRRVFRILPPFYLYLATVSAMVGLGLLQESWRPIGLSAAFLNDLNIGTNPRAWFMGHTWSLAIEEQFYLIFPTLWVLTSAKWKGWVFSGTYGLLIAWNLMTVHHRLGVTIPSVRAGFVCICCGVLIAMNEARLRALARAVPALVPGILGLVLLLHPTGSEGFVATLYECVLVPPAIGLILLFSLERGPLLRALLCCRAAQAIGITSYGVYLWQQLFTAPKTLYCGKAVVIAFLLPLLCVIVPLSYFLVEKPAMRYGRKLAAKTREQSHATVEAD